VYQDGGRRHLGFSNFGNFNGRNAQFGQTASMCQILSKSVKPRPRYGDFSIFQDGGRSHPGFSNFVNFNNRNAQEAKLRHRAKFRRNRLCVKQSKLH